jgi:hypothetical protein
MNLSYINTQYNKTEHIMNTMKEYFEKIKILPNGELIELFCDMLQFDSNKIITLSELVLRLKILNSRIVKIDVQTKIDKNIDYILNMDEEVRNATAIDIFYPEKFKKIEKDFVLLGQLPALGAQDISKDPELIDNLKRNDFLKEGEPLIITNEMIQAIEKKLSYVKEKFALFDEKAKIKKELLNKKENLEMQLEHLKKIVAQQTEERNKCDETIKLIENMFPNIKSQLDSIPKDISKIDEALSTIQIGGKFSNYYNYYKYLKYKNKYMNLKINKTFL